MTDLTGRKALVTGASGGLGAHFAATLAKAGASVTVSARREDALAAVQRQVDTATGCQIATAVLDVTSPDSVAALFADTAPPFDIVVNNAGIATTKPLLDVTEADWDRVIDTNLKGAFLVAQAAAGALVAAGRGGAIVNITSILGLRVAGQVAPYAASKAALIQFTKTAALEWARHGIRVNALSPGYVETPINADFFASSAGQELIRRIPMRQLSQPEDLDGALLLLCSDAGRMMTGTNIVVDGGHTISSL